jgi:hypothetical protein
VRRAPYASRTATADNDCVVSKDSGGAAADLVVAALRLSDRGRPVCGTRLGKRLRDYFDAVIQKLRGGGLQLPRLDRTWAGRPGTASTRLVNRTEAEHTRPHVCQTYEASFSRMDRLLGRASPSPMHAEYLSPVRIVTSFFAGPTRARIINANGPFKSTSKRCFRPFGVPGARV